MIKPIVKDIFFLGRKSEPATKSDLPIATDLRDTLKANADRCVGMAANMSGVRAAVASLADATIARERTPSAAR